MGYAAVASLSQTIDLHLNYNHESISPQFENKIICLHEYIKFMESFFEDAPDRANNWEETIREVTDRAEEIIELLLSDSLLQSKSTVGSSKSKLEKGECEFDYGFDELERVTEEIESIVNRVKGGRRSKAMGGSDDLERLVDYLRETYCWNRLAIVGGGGTGKTTLARNFYNHPFVVEHFDIRAWATISTGYNRRRTIWELLHSMNKLNAGSESNSEEDLIKRVRTVLRGKRSLIVFDDVWSLDALCKVCIDMSLANFDEECKILLTTRSPGLAQGFYSLCFNCADTHQFSMYNPEYVRPNSCLKYGGGFSLDAYNMPLLNVDRTWDLFREKIFKGDPCPSQLECIGKMIAGSCRGHPLSIQVVSGILAADQPEAAWEDIAEDMKIAASDDDDGDEPLQILSLGYAYLPHHLRPCFLYLAIFPKNYEINLSKLIKLWVAEGFLNQSEYKSFEETAEEHVDELARRSLVIVSKRKSNGRIKSITVHDLMRDICLRQARIDKFVIEIESFFGDGRHPQAMKLQWCRHVCTFPYGNDFLEDVYGSTIRTIILSLDDSQLGFKCSIGNVRLLRILDLSNAYNYDLPEEVFELFHLRYLAFHSGFSVSEAISNLENLQTLIIYPRENDGGMFGKLPEGIWRMPQLRHLIVFPFELPSPKEVTNSVLENLQTLSRVVDFICSREDLEMIPNLKKLVLLYIKNMTDLVEDYELHNLVYLQNLEILKIEMDRCFMEQHKISTCAFPPTLKNLSLSNMGLSWEDMGIVASLPNLQVLKLRNHACIGERWETSEGGFSQLTFLLIEESNLENWITKNSHFPKLQCLVLHSCMYLVEVPNDIGGMPTLELIQLDELNHSLLSSAKRIQENRQRSGDDHLEVRVV